MHRLPQRKLLAAFSPPLPTRPWASALRHAVAVGLAAGAGLAWGQTALVVNSSDDITESGSQYYDPGTIDGKYTIASGGNVDIANLTVNSTGQLTVNAGGSSLLTDNISNAGTITNDGTQSTVNLSVNSPATLTFQNSGTWINRGTLNLATSTSYWSTLFPVVNTGTMSNSGDFTNYTTGISQGAPFHNSGTYIVLPGVAPATSNTDFEGSAPNAFVNGPSGALPGLLLVQVTDNTGRLSGSITNNLGSTVQLDPAANTVQTFLNVYGPAGSNAFIEGAGQVLKTSAGTTVFGMPMVYTGPTTVQTGTLLVIKSGIGQGNIATSATTVLSGATLGGDGVLGPVVAQSGSQFAPGNSLPTATSSMGTLSVNGPLQLDASSTSQFELNDPTAATPTTGTPVADGTGDFVAVSGDLLMNGTIRPIPSPGMAEGAYKIFTYGGNLSNSATLDSSLLTPLGLTVQIDTSVPNEVWLVVKKQPAPQTVSFTSTAPSPAYAGGSYQAAASATSGLPATLSSQTPGICTIDGNGLVTLHAAGTCILAANQAGNASWQAAAQATQSFVVSVKPVPPAPAPQTVSFTSLAPTAAQTGGTYQATASATSGLPAVLTSTTPSVCTVDANGLVTLHAAGTCTLAANQAGNASWLAAAEATQSFSVGNGGTTPVAAKPIPTLHPAALALLSLIAAVLGAGVLRRRA